MGEVDPRAPLDEDAGIGGRRQVSGVDAHAVEDGEQRVAGRPGRGHDRQGLAGGRRQVGRDVEGLGHEAPDRERVRQRLPALDLVGRQPAVDLDQGQRVPAGAGDELGQHGRTGRRSKRVDSSWAA